MTIQQLLNYSIKQMKEKQIEEPIIVSRILLAHILKQNKEYLVINDNKEVNKKDEKVFNKQIKRIINNEPLQYITKEQEFMKLNFFVNKNVLIPRQDTEILVEEAINICKNINNPKILDLCTGSGAIAISLEKNIDVNEIIATDISTKALKVAKTNIESNNCLKIKTIKSDLFKKIKLEKFDIIVSNPPYIKTNVIDTLNKNVQKEPKLALDGGKDGLQIYKKIISQSYQFLNKSGFLCLEIGYDQKNDVIDIINKTNKYKDVYCKKDLNGNDRVIICKLI